MKHHHRHGTRPAASLIGVLACLIAFVGVGCGVAVEVTPTASPAPPTAVASPSSVLPIGTPTPDRTVLLRDGGIAIIAGAFDRLMDEYIEPQTSSRLLDAAWTILGQEADKQGLVMPDKPAFTDDRASDFALFSSAYTKLAAAASDPTPLRYGAIRGMTQTLQDCHTFFLNPIAADTLVDTRAGKGSVGIGAELAGIPPLVTEVIGGGPAERAGVLVGDRVVSVDGHDTSNLGPAGALDFINGDENTQVSLTLSRGGSLVDVTATRARVNPPNIDSRLIDGRVAYVRVRNFVDGGVAESLRSVLMSLDAQGATSWIIDLRGNPGGRLDPGAISLWVKDGVIVRDKGRDGLLEEERASGNVLPEIKPTVLLTNNRTGSVSEIFVAALREYGLAYVVGANTNGCVGFTDVQGLGDGSSMAVTTHVNLGPVTGAPLNGIGVAPDESVGRTQDDIANNRDPQLDAAVAHLEAAN
jgi:carboxyl-terminal processing protease